MEIPSVRFRFMYFPSDFTYANVSSPSACDRSWRVPVGLIHEPLSHQQTDNSYYQSEYYREAGVVAMYNEVHSVLGYEQFQKRFVDTVRRFPAAHKSGGVHQKEIGNARRVTSSLRRPQIERDVEDDGTTVRLSKIIRYWH